MTIAEALADAEKRLETLDKDIRLLEWEANQVRLRAESQAKLMRESALQVMGEIKALRELSSDGHTA